MLKVATCDQFYLLLLCTKPKLKGAELLDSTTQFEESRPGLDCGGLPESPCVSGSNFKFKMKRGSSMPSKVSGDTRDLEHEPKRKPVTAVSAARPRPQQSHGGHWSMKLLDTMKDPNMIVKEDDKIVIIKDAYPKAKHHFLVLPKDNISSLRVLNSSHISLLQHMLELGKSLESELAMKDASLRFQHGYHAVPSMTHLHMHIISRDFHSPCLKTKKHWNSFTTEFFLPAEDVICQLQTHGKVEVDKAKYEEILKSPLKCHVCHASCQNMPKLKDHILQHK